MPFNPTNEMHQGAFLPHTNAGGRPQMITFSLCDTLPRDVYKQVLHTASTGTERRRICERYLDNGRGKCWLQIPEAAIIVADTLRFYSGRDYHLIDWIVMPNHVHVVYDKPKKPIEVIAANWKGYSSGEINKILNRTGKKLWQRDYFDRYARCPIHLFNMSCYVILNPVRAGLVDDPFDWPYSSVHDYHPDFKDDLRRWYQAYKDRFWDSMEGS